MLKLSEMSHYTFLFAIVTCLSLPTVGLTAENTTVAGLRARVEVLDQARDKAAAELSAKEQQGVASSRDREHFRTVAEFLDQRIAESCSQLVEKGGTVATADLPCPNPVVQKETGQEKIEEKSSAEESGAQALAKQQEKIVEPEEKQETSPESVQPVVPPSLEAVPAREKMEAPQALPQQPPATGFFTAIRRWFESLFAPKPPPATSGSESGQPAEQAAEEAEKTTAEQENSQRSGDSTAEQAVQNSAAEGNKGSAATTGNREQSNSSAGPEKDAVGEKGSGQEQEQQQQENGDKQAVADGEESGYQSGYEQAGENGAKGAEAAGGKDSKTGEISVAAGSGTTKQKGMQGGSREAANGNAGAEQKAAAGRKGDNNDGQEVRQGASTSGAGERKTADVGPGGKGQDIGQKDGTDQKGPAQPAGQPMAETGKKQAGPVGSGPGGEKKIAQSQKQGSGTSPVSDAEVAKLEQLLSDALGEFDGKLLSEQERLAARIPKQREGSAGGSGGYGAEGPVGPGGSGGIAGGGYESSGGQQGDGRAGAGGHGQSGSVATGGGKSAPAGRRATIDTDDDIVARQLREAAETETDPELKEKLWQEYRKYKQGGG
jgi:hypothetical protein